MSLEVNVTKRFDGFTLHAAFTAGILPPPFWVRPAAAKA